jgi:hypothetical protein
VAFAFGGDVGVGSYTEIEKFCKGSGVGFSVSSGLRSEAGSYHGTGNAVDLVSSAGSMQMLASWLYTTYAAYMLELIHSGGSGYFVKDGTKVPASFYGASTVSQHYNHVHVAMTLSGVAAARGSNPSGTSVESVGSGLGSNVGCAIPTMLGVSGIVISGLGIVEGIWHVFG